MTYSNNPQCICFRDVIIVWNRRKPNQKNRKDIPSEGFVLCHKLPYWYHSVSQCTVLRQNPTTNSTNTLFIHPQLICYHSDNHSSNGTKKLLTFLVFSSVFTLVGQAKLRINHHRCLLLVHKTIFAIWKFLHLIFRTSCTLPPKICNFQWLFSFISPEIWYNALLKNMIGHVYFTAEQSTFL
jgi:hypothetical protein